MHSVATLTSSLVGPLRELALVLVLVAVSAGGVGNFGLEVAALMAFDAGNFQVFSDQRVLGLGVIEFGGERRSGPVRGGVTGFASLLEFALVRVRVAIRAVLVLDASVARQAIIARLVALGAGRGLVLAGQGKAGLGMVERPLVKLRALPGGGAVTLQAVGAKATLVMVLMTGGACGTKTHPGAA